MPQTLYAGVTAPNIYLMAQMLSLAESQEVLTKFGQQIRMPKNKSQMVSARRAQLLPVSTTPLTEGVTPSTVALAYDRVTATVQQYGNLIETTDKVTDLAEDPVLQDMMQVCSQNMIDVKEAVTYGVLKAGSTVFYGNGAARNAVNTTVTVARIRAVVEFLRRNKAKPVTTMQGSDTRYNTRSVEPSFIAFCSSDLENDIRNLTGFKTVADYGTMKPCHPNEFGSLENVRFITSPQLTPWADAGGAKGAMKSTGGANADVYPILFTAQDAYAHVAVRGADSVEPTVLPTGEKSKADPLGQKGFVGYKFWTTVMRLNELWMARLEVASTQL
ncbi:hypothetical protein GCM10007907_27850 [Chitinimonas prasina]|uniref:N4-gp56 family major capsid protein n=1 Tax=Chitinimonas prasina TaxID=1434937 RepID=A0ABQ5YG79_9NEIS|nr:N4-gp56 family major capsid protein [Chitinimonas prasina]GLR13995.1 hypothetical protein GCM10007907_27850 [Chitinimonas prasina]